MGYEEKRCEMRGVEFKGYDDDWGVMGVNWLGFWIILGGGGDAMNTLCCQFLLILPMSCLLSFQRGHKTNFLHIYSIFKYGIFIEMTLKSFS